jgi:hypothetical protein
MPLARATLDLLGPTFVEDVGRHVVPIFTNLNGAPVSVGSGFLVSTADVHLLVTAAHVLDNLADGHRLYFYAAPAMKRAVAGEILLAKVPPGATRKQDTIDIGVVILGGEGLPPYPAIGKSAMTPEALAPFSARRGGNKYAFLGFPASKGVVSRPDKSVRSASYSYLSRAVSPARYSELDLSEGAHVVLPFDAKRIFQQDGRKMNFPKPRGS